MQWIVRAIIQIIRKRYDSQRLRAAVVSRKVDLLSRYLVSDPHTSTAIVYNKVIPLTIPKDLW